MNMKKVYYPLYIFLLGGLVFGSIEPLDWLVITLKVLAAMLMLVFVADLLITLKSVDDADCKKKKADSLIKTHFN